MAKGGLWAWRETRVLGGDFCAFSFEERHRAQAPGWRCGKNGEVCVTLLGEQTEGFSQIQTFGTPESRCTLKKRDRVRQQQHQGPGLVF